jgi:hypothetical protein
MARTTITDEIIDKCRELASKGFSNILISKSLNISITTLSNNKKIVKAIQEGKQELAEIITHSILENLNETQDRLFIAKRLNLFNPQINIKRATNAKEALSNLSQAIKQYADGEINESQLRTIEAVTNSFIKGFEVTELEKRLERLEDEFKQK